ncbi:pyridoxal-phosphate dependent enzyme [Massilia sp. DWR3-1-1]|uniref:pyridoxal-phosphate dependent enzyme n=1 Tax=Massilia sp. DWR3-1-1 TaxID=2804559 RepID=UPI003CF89F82
MHSRSPAVPSPHAPLHAPLHILTPLLESAALSRPGQAVWLKMEALQPAGSFKSRGVGHACSVYARAGARRFVSSSGGNAGIACAYAGRTLGIPVTVVVPETASARAIELIRREGARLIVHGASFQEANEHAQSLLTATCAFIHPFDDPLLWEGHASMIDEVAAAGVRPDAVVLSVGGGGLLCGVVEGLRRHGWDQVPVIAVETAGAASLAAALAADALVSLPAITSIATSLGARRVAQAAFDVARVHPVRSTVVTDGAAVAACLRFIDDHRVVVEPACGAALAAVYEGTALAGFDNVLVIVCGGVTATVAQLQQWAATLPHPG